MRASHSLLSARQAVSPNPSRRKRGGLAYVDGGHAASANLNEQAMRVALEYTYLAQRLMN